MGKLNDLKTRYYGGFIEWLKNTGTGDIFHNDIWADKIFDLLLEQYKDDCKKTGTINHFMTKAPIKVIEEMLENKRKMASENKKIIQPGGKRISIPGPTFKKMG